MNCVVAISRAQYRGVLLWETAAGGISIFLGEKRYDFLTLDEATAFIDACYAAVVMPN